MEKKIIIFVTLLFSAFNIIGVNNTIKAKGVENTLAHLFFAKLSEQSKDLSSITSQFTQTKYLKLLDTKIISEGNFYYKKRGKIRFDYLSPKKMSILMLPEKLQIIASEKKTTYDLSSQKSLNDLAAVMEACISGNISYLPKDYEAHYELNKDVHIIRIKQLSKNANNPYSLIELRLNLLDYSLEQLTLFEKSEDYTIYSFKNITLNQDFSTSLFAL